MVSKILIADDDPLMHALYKNYLEKAGFALLMAMDGDQAMDVASREQPTIILMDIMMRTLDGLTALRSLKKSDHTKAIPVIVTTANVAAHDAVRKESLQSGAASFLPKPFSPAQLLAEVKKVLGQ